MQQQTTMKRLGYGIWIGFLFFVGLYLAISTDIFASGDVFNWHKAGIFPRPVGDGAAFILSDTLYYAGGWVGNPGIPLSYVEALPLPAGESDSWSQVSPLDPARFGVAVAVHNEHVYILGGYGGGYLSRVDSFDGVNWRQERDLGISVWSPSSIATQARIYVAGGEIGANNMSNQVRSASFEADNTLGDWRQESNLPLGLITRLVANEKCLYIIGGKDSGGNQRAEIYRTVLGVDGVLQGWTAANLALPRPLALHAVTMHLDTLYVLGGETTGGALNDQVYSIGIDPDTCALIGTWASSPLPGDGNRRLAVASRWGELYITGGQTATGYSSDAWQTKLATPTAALTLRKSATLDDEFDYGKLITYTLSYANPWPHPDGQTGVVITDTLPASTTLVSAASGYVLTNTDTLRWDIGALAQGASGAVTFTVQVPPPDLAWDLDAQKTAHWNVEETMYISSEVVYTIAYTPTVDVSSDAVLVTATLPAQLFPLRVDPPGVPYAVQGNTVIWRVPGPIAATGQVSVTTCVLQAFNVQDPLTYTVALEDVLGHTTTQTYNQALAPGEDALVQTSCLSSTNQIAHPAAVSPLYPDIVIRNQAWICSNELEGCQSSTETITRYWPVKVFLPLVMRQQ